MSDCLFCKIIKGEIPNHTVYEDDFVLAFLDIYPHAKGHTVVVPKMHAESFFDINEEMLQFLAVGLRRAMERIEHVLHPDGYNIGWNEKPAGGQVVPHLHIHIMPRYEGDGGGSVHAIVRNDGGISAAEVAKLFL